MKSIMERIGNKYRHFTPKQIEEMRKEAIKRSRETCRRRRKEEENKEYKND